MNRSRNNAVPLRNVKQKKPKKKSRGTAQPLNRYQTTANS